MSELTTIEVHNIIVENAKTSSQEVRIVKKILPGQAIRQGDIYMICVNPKGETVIPATKFTNELLIDTRNYKTKTKNRQLAPGTSKGSRHIITSVAEIFEYTNTRWDILGGPLVVSDVEIVLAHPEHAHYRLPAGTYAVRFQRNYAKDQILRNLD